MNQPALPPSAQLMRMLTATWTAKAIGLFARLKLADHLADGTTELESLAAATNTHAGSLGRLLRLAGAAGIVNEPFPRVFQLTGLGEMLRSDVPGSCRAMAVMVTDPEHYNAWGALEHAVRTGKPAFDHVYGKPFFDRMSEDAEAAAIFNAAMTGIAAANYPPAVAAYDFGRHNLVVDVGGGHGTLLSLILQRNPHLHGVVCDLPQVVENAGRTFEHHGVAERASTFGGSFFEDVAPDGDAYVLSHVIHDWDDEHCIQILKTISRRMFPEGKVLLFEQIMPDRACPDPAFSLDMNMLVMTTGGRERTLEQYQSLLEAAGFSLSRVHKTPVPTCIIEATQVVASLSEPKISEPVVDFRRMTPPPGLG